MEELVGQQIGKHEILQWLGEGAHVHAYLARDKKSGDTAVIKVLKSDLAGTEEFLERFHKEAQAALGLNHPNLVRVLDYSQDGDTLYLVEEVMANGSLMDIFNREPDKPLPLDTVAKTVEQIAAVLDYAHAQGIVHRDLKPENILYDSKGNAHLSDLGITKSINPETARKRSDLEFGNPNYMAPEAWQGKVDVRTDVYAFGVIVYEMLTGKLPFHSQLKASYLYAHLMHLMSKPAPLHDLRPDLPRALSDVLDKALEKEPDNRYASAGEFAAAFKAALNGK